MCRLRQGFRAASWRGLCPGRAAAVKAARARVQRGVRRQTRSGRRSGTMRSRLRICHRPGRSKRRIRDRYRSPADALESAVPLQAGRQHALALDDQRIDELVQDLVSVHRGRSSGPQRRHHLPRTPSSWRVVTTPAQRGQVGAPGFQAGIGGEGGAGGESSDMPTGWPRFGYTSNVHF
jgi:hypothetical protein